MDKRSYFFSRLAENSWGFIAKNTDYKGNHIPIEKWTCKNKSYIFCRICYTVEAAAALAKKSQEENIDLMEGPDIYAVINEAGKTIITMWKPQLEDLMEITYTDDNNHDFACTIKETVTADKLKIHLQKLMGLENVVVTELSKDNYSYHVELVK